jgi:hypothetical protein
MDEKQTNDAPVDPSDPNKPSTAPADGLSDEAKDSRDQEVERERIEEREVRKSE